MAHDITAARPYAKAIFELAKASDSVNSWLEVLHDLALLAKEKVVADYISNPTIAPQESATLLMTILENKLSVAQQNLLRLLSESRQLSLLIPIEALFFSLHARDSQTVNVKVISAVEMNPTQKTELVTTLKNRLQKHIAPEYEIDPSLIGGVVLRTDEWVMDGSVKHKLEQLKTSLIG
jgi:F-type H+-transporting ATPase subunit delta